GRSAIGVKDDEVEAAILVRRRVGVAVHHRAGERQIAVTSVCGCGLREDDEVGAAAAQLRRSFRVAGDAAEQHRRALRRARGYEAERLGFDPCRVSDLLGELAQWWLLRAIPSRFGAQCINAWSIIEARTTRVKSHR